MKIKGNRFVTSILAASMLSGTFFVPASAGELEGESAIAGMAVTLNNYYAGEETPDEAILDYLVPKAQATSEAESETETEEPKTVMAATVAVTSDASNVGLVSAAGYLNVREQPSTGSVTVGRLFSNCQVNIKSSVNNSEGSWYRITCGDVEGYVSAAYVLVGTAAKTAEDNIQNRYAVVTADQLNVRDSASDSANVVGTVYKDEEYAIIEDQGDFVKIHIANDEVGYVSKSGITIKTQFAQAQKVDNEYQLLQKRIRAGNGRGNRRRLLSCICSYRLCSRASWLLQRICSRFWIRRFGSNLKAGAGKRTCTCRCSI